MLDYRFFSSLVKIFPDEGDIVSEPLHRASALKGETYSFQLAYRTRTPGLRLREGALRVSGTLAPYVRIRQTGLVPVTNIDYSLTGDEAKKPYLRRGIGLYPDVLLPGEPMSVGSSWSSLWIDAVIPSKAKAGHYDLEIGLGSEANGKSERFQLEVLDAELPPQTLKHTEWFYCDCIFQAHKVEAWSEESWTILERYFRNFAEQGINMILTPVFTPPLDTAIGGERMTTQLIAVRKKGKSYEFDFSRFERWVKLAQKCGIRYFEISHLFTQWGAKFCPKIVADAGGKEKKIFGWDTASDSAAYRSFLAAFLPELVKEIRKLRIQDSVYFHVSDEPEEDHADHYRKCSEFLKKFLAGFKFIDAASHTSFYEKGLISIPVPSEMVLEKFMKFDIAERWTYYCCGPWLPYSNRMHAFPASANRIIGVLLYLYQVEGFLHWGYNFWNRGLSGVYGDPLGANGDAVYPTGDGCLVYPGEDGPLDSCRGVVFAQGLQDMRALQKLESISGRKKVLDMIRELAGYDIRMDHFPLDETFLLKLREKVNAAIVRGSVSARKK